MANGNFHLLGESGILKKETLGPLIALGSFFLVLIGLVLLNQNVGHLKEDPLQTQTLISLKEDLRQSPKDEALKDKIREVDLQTRQSYFSHLNRNRMGAWLLLFGVAFSVGLYGLSKRLDPELPDAEKIGTELKRRLDQRVPYFQWLPIVAMFAFTFLIGLGVAPGRIIQSNSKMDMEPTHGESKSFSYPSNAEIQLQWPQFMGPNGNGFSATANPPSSFPDGFASKTPISIPGNSSPVVWDQWVFITGGTVESRSVTTFELTSGKPLWTTPFPQLEGQSIDVSSIPEDTGLAACTPAVDGRAVYAVFTTGEVMAVDLQGNVLWSRFLGPIDNPYGHAASLMCHEGLLFVQLDQAHEPGQSKILALNTQDGRVVWQKSRPVICSWATPIRIGTDEDPLLFTISDPFAIVYRIRNGEEIWRSNMLSGEVTPSPVSAGGLVFVVTPWDKLAAFEFDLASHDDEPEYDWVFEDNVPDIATPATDGERIYLLTTPGTLTCMNVASGAVLWTVELETEFHASPVLSRDEVFVVSTEGEVIILANQDTTSEVNRISLGERVVATPALKKNHLIIRGTDHLFILQNNESLASLSP